VISISAFGGKKNHVARYAGYRFEFFIGTQNARGFGAHSPEFAQVCTWHQVSFMLTVELN